MCPSEQDGGDLRMFRSHHREDGTNFMEMVQIILEVSAGREDEQSQAEL